MAVEPTTPALDRRVLDSLPAAEIREPRPRGTRFLPRKGLAFGLAALVLTVATAVGVSAFLRPPLSGGTFLLDGQTWDYRSAFNGEVTFRDPAGRPVGGKVSSLNGWPGMGEVILTVEGRRYQFTNPGEHPVRDAEGRLLGSAVMRVLSAEEVQAQLREFLARYGIQTIPQTPDEVRETMWKVSAQNWDTWGTQKEPDGSVVQGSRLGVLGFNHESGVYWKVRGAVIVSVLEAEGKLHDRAVALEGADPAGENPEVVIIRGGQTTSVRGYGLHEIRDDEGRLLLILKVEPFTRQ